jgi:hypothetical protein
MNLLSHRGAGFAIAPWFMAPAPKEALKIILPWKSIYFPVESKNS